MTFLRKDLPRLYEHQPTHSLGPPLSATQFLINSIMFSTKLSKIAELQSEGISSTVISRIHFPHSNGLLCLLGLPSL